MYLVENESNPVRLLSVGLPQCSGRVKLSLNINKVSTFVHCTLQHSFLASSKFQIHLGTLDDNCSVGKGKGNSTNGGVLEGFQAVALLHLFMGKIRYLRHLQHTQSLSPSN